MNKRGGTIFTTVLLFLILFVIISGIAYKSSSRSIAFIELNYSKYSSNLQEEFNSYPSEGKYSDFIMNIISKLTDMILYITFSISNFTKDFVISNDWVNWTFLMWLLIISILAPLLYTLIKFIILIVILIKDTKESYRDRKELKLLKERKNG